MADAEPSPPGESLADPEPPGYWYQAVWRQWRPELVHHTATLLITLTVLATDFAAVSLAVGILVGVAKIVKTLGVKDIWADAILVFHKVVVLGALGILAWFLFRDLVQVHNRRTKS